MYMITKCGFAIFIKDIRTYTTSLTPHANADLLQPQWEPSAPFQISDIGGVSVASQTSTVEQELLY